MAAARDLAEVLRDAGLTAAVRRLDPEPGLRLAEAMLPLFAEDEEEAARLATARLEGFTALFEAAHERVLRAKLGLGEGGESALAMGRDLLERMATNEVDFTLFFRRLCASAADPSADAEAAALFADPGAFRDWAEGWRARLATEDVTPAARSAAMKRANPAFIPRNHRVEEVLAAAIHGDDYAPFETLSRVLAKPYDDQPEYERFSDPPPAGQAPYRTFCGT